MTILFNKLLEGPENRAWTRSGTGMSSQEKILEVIDGLRPYIQADGGDVEFLDYDELGGVVQVRLMGACESCPISMMTLKEGLEKRIKNTVPGVTEVMAV
jgi:Fe-S cluster biogenesis protein NfuA